MGNYHQIRTVKRLIVSLINIRARNHNACEIYRTKYICRNSLGPLSIPFFHDDLHHQKHSGAALIFRDSKASKSAGLGGSSRVLIQSTKTVI